MANPALEGRLVRLEPLSVEHAEALAAASRGAAPELYRWTQVPHSREEAERYIAQALAMRELGASIPFATIRRADGRLVGSTRLCNIERWSWPAGHPRHGRPEGDICEIGYTWLAPEALRTGINTEAKLLMLAYAFESCQMLGVCLHTDARNQRSRTAIERIGGHLDGVLRAHRLGADLTARDSIRYSFIAAEWPAVRDRLAALLLRD